MAALEQATERSNYVGYLAQQHGLTNPRQVFEDAMETIFYATPEFRDRITQDTVNSAVADAAKLASKKAKAGSLSGRGGAAPKPTPEAPANDKERFNAIVGLLKADMAE